MAFQKIDKKFVLSDSSVNVYGMRLLTSGYQIEEFKRNPIGYYGHDPKDGVLLRWDDVQLDGDHVVGWPAVNLDHPRGQRTVNELEDGFLNSASVGKLCILEYHLEDNTEDPKKPTVVVTKWYNKECSVVDNPGNRAAMKVELFDAEENEINLADITDVYFKSKISNMREVTLPLDQALIGLLGLGDEITADAVRKGIEHLHSENTRLGTELAAEKAAATSGRIKAILDKGLSDGKFNKVTRDGLEVSFAGQPDALQKLVDGMDNYVSITDRLGGDAVVLKDKDGKEINLSDCTFDQIDQAGHLEKVKAEHPAVYDRIMADLRNKQSRK